MLTTKKKKPKTQKWGGGKGDGEEERRRKKQKIKETEYDPETLGVTDYHQGTKAEHQATLKRRNDPVSITNCIPVDL